MFPEAKFLDVNGIRMAVHEDGEGPAVVFVHGFPELAYSWRHQLPALADAGFRAIAPDMRGYGRTDAPDGIDAYNMQQLIGDLLGLLDALGIERATFVGHDWGAIILWHMAMLAPDRMENLIALNIPHSGRMRTDPIERMREKLGDNFYIVNFQDSNEADRAFAADPGHFIDMMMRKNQISRQRFEQLPPHRRVLDLLQVMRRTKSSGDPLLSDDERDVYARAFQHSGFTGPINWYRNWTQNWRALDGIDQTIAVPTLFIGAADDVVVPLRQIEAMKSLVNDLVVEMLEPCGHWTQQERPDEVNRLIIHWLNR